MFNKFTYDCLKEPEKYFYNIIFNLKNYDFELNPGIPKGRNLKLHFEMFF